MSLSTVYWDHEHAGANSAGIARVQTTNANGTHVASFGAYCTVNNSTLDTSEDFSNAIAVPIVGWGYADTPSVDTRNAFILFQTLPWDGLHSQFQSHIWWTLEP